MFDLNGDGHVDATEVYCMVLVIYSRINQFALVTLSCPPKRQINHLVETFDLDDSGEWRCTAVYYGGVR